MAEQFGEKSQEATPHRRQQAREKGQVPKSQDLTSAIMLIAAILILMAMGGKLVEFLSSFMKRQLGETPASVVDEALLTEKWSEINFGLAYTLFPILALLMLIAVVTNLAQVGILFLPDKVAPDPGHINPYKGIKRLFSLTNAVKLGFGIFKIMIVMGVAVLSLWSDRIKLMSLGGIGILETARLLTDVLLWTSLKVGIALLILAILDYAYQRWKFEQDLRMTEQEVREEMKNLQGDPQVIARRRTIQRQLALNRMSNDVPKADVVVTNPTELAIAIKYDYDNMIAPIVIAKGAGLVAQKIRRIALENSIPIVERKELARMLYKDVDINEAIPTAQYAAVAEVLRYVYELQGKSLPAPKQAA